MDPVYRLEAPLKQPFWGGRLSEYDGKAFAGILPHRLSAFAGSSNAADWTSPSERNAFSEGVLLAGFILSILILILHRYCVSNMISWYDKVVPQTSCHAYPTQQHREETKMKRLFAVLLLLAMALATIPAQAESEPVTIKFWHHRGSGAQYDCVMQAVNTFNETVGKEKGIVVEETYIGGYVDLFTQLQLSAQSGDAPNICSAANTYVAYMLEDDMLVDMAALAEAEGYDIFSNQQEWQLTIGGNTDGQMHSVGYCRSCPLFYYNKAIAAELGIEIGETITIDELVRFGEAAMKKDANGATTRYGFTMFNDFGYYNAAFIYQLGSEYIGPEGSGQPRCLTDGTMLKVLTDWRNWVDAGWCMPFAVTDPGSVAQSMFIEGNLAAVSYTHLTTIISNFGSLTA